MLRYPVVPGDTHACQIYHFQKLTSAESVYKQPYTHTQTCTHITYLQDKEKLELVLTKKHNLPFSTINFFKQMMCLYKS